MCHGNVMSRGMSRLMEMPRLISWKLLFPRETLAFNTRNITCCHACPRVENEVIIEWYCIISEIPTFTAGQLDKVKIVEIFDSFLSKIL